MLLGMIPWRRQGLVQEFAGILFVVVVTALNGLVTQDVVFGDETGYLAVAQGLKAGRSVAFEDSAGYVQLYAIVGKFSDDPVGVYFAMRSLSAVAFVVGFWIAARLLVGPFLAWAGAAALATFSVTYAWPGVAGLAAGLVLVGTAFLARYRSFGAMTLTTAAAWLAASMRPEFTWLAATFTIWCSVWILLAIRSGKLTNPQVARRAIFGAVSLLVIPLILFAQFGLPFGSSRAFAAFAQHYALRAGEPYEDPWLNAFEIVARDFPGANSPLQALLTNPNAILEHISQNVRHTPTNVARQVLNLPSNENDISLVALSMILVLVASLMMSLALKKMVGNGLLTNMQPQHSRRVAWNEIATKIPLALIGCASIIPVILLYPRDHYLLLPIAFLLLTILVCQARFGSRSVERLLPYGLVLVLTVVFSLQVYRAATNRVTNPAPTAQALSWLRSTAEDWVIVSDDWGLESGLSVFVPEAKVLRSNYLSVAEAVEALREEPGSHAFWISHDPYASFTGELDGNSLQVTQLEALGFRPISARSGLYVCESPECMFSMPED